MSKIVLFYEKDERIAGTVVNGNAFSFVSYILANLDCDELYVFIDEGMKNNGYHWNSVREEYEFWSAGKNSVNQNFNDVSQIDNSYDGVFKVDAEKILVQVK